MLYALITVSIGCAVALVGCGLALGYRRALQASEGEIAHLRAQVAHLTNAPQPPPKKAREGDVRFPDFGAKEPVRA